MTLTPLEIQKRTFNKCLRGFDETQVEIFLEEVATQMTNLIKENNSNKDKIRTLELRIAEFLEREKTVNETLSVVKKVSEDMKESAKKQGETIISEAKNSAREIFIKLQDEVKSLKNEIGLLKNKRKEIRISIVNFLKNHIDYIQTSSFDEKELSDDKSENSNAPVINTDIPVELRRNRNFDFWGNSPGKLKSDC